MEGLPELCMEIVQVPDVTPERLADGIIAEEASRGKLTHTGTSLPWDGDGFLILQFMELPETGRGWDDCLRTYYIRENGKGGCFRIEVQYFLEAGGGFAYRCAYYVSTLEVLTQSALTSEPSMIK